MSDAVKVTLGRQYEPDMWDLRKQIAAARKSGQSLVFVDLRVPINSDVVGLALRSGDLYLIGIRNGVGVWYEFDPGEARSDPESAGSAVPLLPGSQWIAVGSRRALSSYVALHLPQLIATGANRYPEGLTKLIAFFSGWDGRIDVDYTRLRVCVLTFIVCEALRFRSIENIARNWMLPAEGYSPAFEITGPMLDLAQDWRKKAASGDSDVQTWLPGMPDRLID
jgi:hypothetical protein